MTETGARRRLVAILVADVVGYSRLMAADEDATVTALDAARAVFKARIEENQGRIIDTAGDSVLALFETAVGAVRAALAIQNALRSDADATSEDRRMRFRIGVHLGDVIEKDDGTIYGDGVNVAARLQGVAEPGEVAVSGIVRETVQDRMAALFEDQGEHAVKNIARPVHVYRVVASERALSAAPTSKFAQRVRRMRWRIAGVGALLILVAVAAWIASADSATQARAVLATWFGKKPAHVASSRASIAVMPFANLSGDPKRDYFSAGITQDIINALGRFSGVIVISHNAVQAFKGRPMTSTDISRELGVRYIAQGSVREADGRLRVAVELSDAENGAQLWSERFDGAGADVFEIQDRIVKSIVGALAVKLTRIEQERVFTKPTDSLEAYDLVLRARSLLELQERRSNREARGLLERAEKLAPGFADMLTSRAEAEFQRAIYGWIEDAVQGLKVAEELCKRALASTDQNAHVRAYAVLASVYGHQDQFEEALRHAERAIALNASDSTALHRRGSTLLSLGRIEEAISAMETARRFDPHSVVLGLNLAIAYFAKERYRDAIEQIDAALARAPHHVALNALRAATLAQLGKADEATRAAEQVRRFSPMFDVENFGTRFANPGYAAKLQEGLRKAGL